MSAKLRELIRSVRQCKTAAEERAVIAKECALIRTYFKDTQDTGHRHRNVAKLLYIHMLGYPTHFGQMESLKLIASSRFPEKRIGYLGLMLLLDESSQVLMLVTNSLKNDFTHRNPFIVGLALCSLGNIASADMARDLSNEVEKLFRSGNPYIRKKAALCAVRIVRKVPDVVEDFVPAAIALLQDKTHAVLLAGVTLIIEMVKIDRGVTRQFRKLVPIVVRLLKSLVLAGYVSEYDVCGITDPFLQCKLIELLRLLGKGSASASDEMNDILAQVAINTEQAKNPGNAILYETVQTIMHIEAESGLRVLAINILGRFLLNKDNNIRYVALATMCQLVNTDTAAIQRHRNVIVDCLKDSDVSIRRRALDLIYALVTRQNVKQLVSDLLNYLAHSSGDAEFKADLTDTICLVVERHAPNKRWHIDTVVTVLATAGSFTRELVLTGLIALISRCKSLHSYSVHTVYRALSAMKDEAPQLPLIHAALWCLGEFGERLVSEEGTGEANQYDDGNHFAAVSDAAVVDAVERVLTQRRATSKTKSYALNALVKLGDRLPGQRQRCGALLAGFKSHMDADLQQRSVEYAALFQPALDDVRGGVLTVMPPIAKRKADAAKTKGAAPGTSKAADFSSSSSDEATDTEGESSDSDSDSGSDSDSDSEEEEPQPKKGKAKKGKSKQSQQQQQQQEQPAAAAASSNPLDLLSELFDSGAVPQAQPPQQQQSAGLDPLDLLMGGGPMQSQPPQQQQQQQQQQNPLDLLGGGAPQQQQQQQQAPAQSGKIPAVVPFEADGLRVQFQFKKPPSNPQRTQIMASFSNATGSDMTGFSFNVAVPKYIRLQKKPISASTVPANSQNLVTMLMQLENTQHGAKKLALRIKIDYTQNGQPVTKQAQINEFPAGV